MTWWVVGVGSMGSVVAGKLGGHVEMILVDGWDQNVAAIRARGLQVDYPEGTVVVRPSAYELGEAASIGAAPDVVLLCVKSEQTRTVMTALAPHLADRSTVVSIQNSLNEETIASVVGAHRTIGATVRMDGNLVGPGHGRSISRQRKLTIGELDGTITDRLRAIRDTLGRGIQTELTDNIWGLLWTKMVRNAEVNALAAVTGLDTARLSADPVTRRLALRLGMEAVGVALALGMRLDEDELYGPAESYLRPFGSPAMNAIEERFRQSFATPFRPSMLQDVEKGRPTEIDHMNGLIVDKGKAVGVPTPLNAALTRLVKEIDAGKRKPDPSVVGAVLAPFVPPSR